MDADGLARAERTAHTPFSSAPADGDTLGKSPYLFYHRSRHHWSFLAGQHRQQPGKLPKTVYAIAAHLLCNAFESVWDPGRYRSFYHFPKLWCYCCRKQLGLVHRQIFWRIRL